MRELEAITVQQEEVIDQLHDRLNIAEWAHQSTDTTSDMLAEHVSGITSAFAAIGLELADARGVIKTLQMMMVVIMVAFMLVMWI